MSAATETPPLQPIIHPVRTGWELWRRFWFAPIPAARIGLLRLWLFGFVLVDVLLRKEAWVGLADIPRLFWRPVGATWMLDQVGIGPPSAVAIVAVQATLAVAALCAAVGYRYRLSAPIAAVLYLYWQCLGQSWGEMKHARVTLILALLFLSVVSAQQSRSLDALRARMRTARRELRVVEPPPIDEPSNTGAWAVRAIQVGLAVLYFLSGYSKLRAIGIDWIWGDTLSQAIQDKASSGEATSLAMFALRHTWMLIGFQAVTLAWELGFPLVFFRRLRYPVLIVGAMFNIGLWVTVKIEFFGVFACFAAFLPLEQYEQRVRLWIQRRHSDKPPVRVSYDGWCSVCTATATFLRTADWARRLRLLNFREGNLPAGMSHERARQEILVERDGRTAGGYDAMTELVDVLPPLLPLRPFARRAPVRAVGERIYRAVATGRAVRHCEDTAVESPLVARAADNRPRR